MKKLAILLTGAATLLSTAAFGGSVQPFPVDVDLTNLNASGDMVTARYSENDNEFIGCGIRIIQDGVGGVFSFGFCQAEDRDGVRAFCNSQDAALLDAISSSGDYGFITFSYDEDDVCTRIGFSNQSFYLPKKLKSNE